MAVAVVEAEEVESQVVALPGAAGEVSMVEGVAAAWEAALLAVNWGVCVEEEMAGEAEAEEAEGEGAARWAAGTAPRSRSSRSRAGTSSTPSPRHRRRNGRST